VTLKLTRPTGDVELGPSGPSGHAFLALDGHTPATGFIRIVVDLSPDHCLDMAAELIVIARRARSIPEGA